MLAVPCLTLTLSSHTEIGSLKFSFIWPLSGVSLPLVLSLLIQHSSTFTSANLHLSVQSSPVSFHVFLMYFSVPVF